MPKITIVLPTYNRQHFLPGAFLCLSQQTEPDWELIIVDDGSSDDSLATIESLNLEYQFPLTLIKQPNAGPAAARNRGIDAAKGDFIAFFDSDDTWEPQHLELVMKQFAAHPEIDWVYTACRRIDRDTEQVLLTSTFYNESQPNMLFSVADKVDSKLYILRNAEAASVQLLYGIDSGLQNSVIRAHVFKSFRLPLFRVGEDRLFILQALKRGVTIAFYDEVTVNYFVHDQNTSDTNPNNLDWERREKSMRTLLTSYEATFDLVSLNKAECDTLNKRLADDYFWKLGYAILLNNKQYGAALQAMFRGIRYNPFKIRFWKSFIVALLRAIFRR